MVHAKGPTARLCDWACSTRYSDIPAEVRKETETIFYDTIGGMVASSTLPSCQPVVDIVKSFCCAGKCSIVGHPVKTSVTYAALANGTIGHGAEVDATGQHATGHFPAVTVPAAITVGQYVNASGKELLRALALGSEVAARINSVLEGVSGHDIARRHFWGGIIGSTIGAAVLSSLLLKLNAEQMEHAMALSASQTSGLACIFHDPTHQSKSLQFGIAAHGGVLAALLAHRGFHGSPEILTLEHGLFDGFTGYASLGNRVVDELGQTYSMHQIAYKRFPVGGPNQTAVHIFLQLLRDHSVRADDIERVEVTLSRSAFMIVATLKHPSVYLPTILSIAAVFGEVTFQHIHEDRYNQDPRVDAFKDRIRLLPHSTMGSPGSRLEVGVRVYTRSGETFAQQMRYPLMNEQELQHKFRYLVGLRIKPEKVLDLENKLKAIESVDNVAPLISELELASS